MISHDCGCQKCQYKGEDIAKGENQEAIKAQAPVARIINDVAEDFPYKPKNPNLEKGYEDYFNIEDTVYYLKGNEIGSSKVVARHIVENENNFITTWGPSNCNYALADNTVVSGKLAYSDVEELLFDLKMKFMSSKKVKL